MDLNRASTEFVRGLTFEDLDHSVDDIILEKIDFMDSSFAFCDIRHCPSTVRWHCFAMYLGLLYVLMFMSKSLYLFPTWSSMTWLEVKSNGKAL